MKRLCAAVLILGVSVGLAGTASALPPGHSVSTYRANLAFPIDMAWVEGTKKFFFTEKNTGKIRVMIGRRLKNRPCVRLNVASAGESGALGIVLHPNFKNNHWLYVYFTNASPRENRVTRFKVEDNRCGNRKVIVKGLAAGSGYHNGGQLEFVGNKLFVSVGENHSPANAQQTSSRLGKILRFNADGSIPDGNPFSLPGNPNPVWSYGHRNPFGLGHKPGTKQLFETENGPSCDDELNRIKKGRNYGWGEGYSCGSGVGVNPKGPMRRWTPVIVPTDLWWYRGRMNRLTNRLYMGDFSSGKLHRFKLNRKGTRIRKQAVIFNNPSGIVDVSEGPGGWLYFLTSSSIRRIHT